MGGNNSFSQLINMSTMELDLSAPNDTTTTTTAASVITTTAAVITTAIANLTTTTSTTISPTTDVPAADIEPIHACQWILYREIGSSRIRLWDFVIALPNLIFFIFLCARFRVFRKRLTTSHSPIMSTFYVLVLVNVIASLLRCFISMSVNASSSVGGTTDKIFWVLVRFFLFATEMSVLVFGLAFGHLDSRTSIKRVLLLTSCLSLFYSILQGTLEIVAPDEDFYISSKEYHLYSHGGMVFWMSTSLILATMYGSVSILPWTPCRHRVSLPRRKSFYIYTGILSTLNLVQAFGSILYHAHLAEGLCLVDMTTYLYFTAFTPLVYWTFLSAFFSNTKSAILFSYKAQMDDGDQDAVLPGANSAVAGGTFSSSAGALPHQLSCSSIRTDNSDFVYGGQKGTLVLDTTPESSQLYECSTFSPDSVRDSTDVQLHN